MSKFTEGTELSYAELPMPVSYLTWKRGNGQLDHLKDIDPGAYFGGWSAMVEGEEGAMPSLPIPIVSRRSDDGKAIYTRYATNVINFLPVAYRLRYELREKSFDPKRGRDVEKVVAVVKKYVKELHAAVKGIRSGYQPMKQIFGLVYSSDGKDSNPAVMKINSWSAFFSFDEAVKAWARIKIDENHILVRRYGSIGAKDKSGQVFPNFLTFNDGKSTPIEAIGVASPMIIPVTPELDQLWNDAQDWAKCVKWNAVEVYEHALPALPETSEDLPFGMPDEESIA